MSDKDERLRRWRPALGDPPGTGLSKLTGQDARIGEALDQLYGQAEPKSRKGGLGSSAPRVAKWLGELRDLFPVEVVQTVVDQLMVKLEARTQDAVRGALRRSARTRRPRFADIDWDRTVRANLQHWQPAHKIVVPERIIGHSRGQRRIGEVVLLVDQSGSMAPSVVYASIFAAVLASLPALSTKLVCFDTAIVDLSDILTDTVEVLFGIQLGGGTDICGALGYVTMQIPEPSRTHLVLVSDLYEGGDGPGMLARAQALVSSGVNLIVLLAVSDEGRPSYDSRHAAAFASMGCPVFACTPEQFPDLMAVALSRGDVAAWAASRDIALVRGDGSAAG